MGENFGVYGARNVWRAVWRAPNHEGRCGARYTVARLMGENALRGVVRGRRSKTTRAAKDLGRPADRVTRVFEVSRPTVSWVPDLTYVATWRGFVYGSFAVDASMRDGSSAGASRPRCTPSSPSTPLNRPRGGP